MNSGHAKPEDKSCPICCLPIALPTGQHSVLKPCCIKPVCHGCLLASDLAGMGDLCPYCRTPFPDSDAAGLALIQKRVDARDPTAMSMLADEYQFGTHGLQKDIPRAIELWTDAAQLGDLSAHFNLGYVYYFGGPRSMGTVEQDKAKGILHWQHAAIKGHHASRFILGNLEFEDGDEELAVQHFMISTKMGDEDSLNMIKSMFMEGFTTRSKYAEALKGYQSALKETESSQRDEAKAAYHKDDGHDD